MRSHTLNAHKIGYKIGKINIFSQYNAEFNHLLDEKNYAEVLKNFIQQCFKAKLAKKFLYFLLKAAVLLKAVTRLTKTNEFCWYRQRARYVGQSSNFCKKSMTLIHRKQIVISCWIAIYYYKITFCYNVLHINIDNA